MNRSGRIDALNQSVAKLHIALANVVGTLPPFSDGPTKQKSLDHSMEMARTVWRIGGDLQEDLDKHGDRMTQNTRVEIRSSLDLAKRVMKPLGFDCWNRSDRSSNAVDANNKVEL